MAPERLKKGIILLLLYIKWLVDLSLCREMQTMCLCRSPNPNNIIHLFISAQSRRPAGLTCHGCLNGESEEELTESWAAGPFTP